MSGAVSVTLADLGATLRRLAEAKVSSLADKRRRQAEVQQTEGGDEQRGE
ncbi:hypothetical protein [Rhizobium paknamense]|uniref:Uncharacterized protein n=1 Tax=Rhizobium paknamense TaxID=1206817 RepID=A0ABU0I7S4_9HYPH|nr:hypothetical protein [Rhizobium paknamense]MDQ0454285.1 hypothetical protein [Rhizobium paknamense]